MDNIDAVKPPLYFRRRTDRLTWHTNPSCPKWPLKDFVEDAPKGPMARYMICPKCVELDAFLNDKGALDDPTGFKSLY